MLSYFGGMALATLALTCGDLQSYYKQDQITEQKYSCSLGQEKCDQLKLSRLQKTVKHFTDEDIAGKSYQELYDEYDPRIVRYTLGTTAIEGVDISLGDNPFVLFFWENSDNEADVSSHDGSLVVGKNYCDADLSPYLSDARVAKVCEAILPEVKKKAPLSQLTMEYCTSGIDIYVDDHTDTNLSLSMSRNLADVKAGYFVCNAEMKRKTNEVSNLSCEVKP